MLFQTACDKLEVCQYLTSQLQDAEVCCQRPDLFKSEKAMQGKLGAQ